MDAFIEPTDAAATTPTSQSPPQSLSQADVEDLKTDIPYFDDQQVEQQQQGQQGQPSEAASDAGDGNEDDFDASLLALGKSECELIDYANWGETKEGNDENYQDDSDYGGSSSCVASSSVANSSSYYQPSPTPSNGELMLRPPSSSSYHYSYSSPSPPATSSAAASVMQLQMAQSRIPAGYSHSQGAAPPPPGFYANMWYPNASYSAASSSGSGNSSSGGVGAMPPNAAYNRYYGAGAAYHSPQHGQQQHHHHHPHQQQQQQQHPHHHHPHHHHQHETMMEMFQLSNSGREARNRAEKNRRDKLNGSIQELSTMVPHVAESPRRVDKTAVLRFAAHGLRLKYVFGKTMHQQRPQITDTLMSMLDSFFVTLTCHGQILLISSSIEQHLGHCQTDLYGQSILQITHPEDQNMLKQQLIPTELENLFDANAAEAEGAEPRQRSKSEEDYIDRKLREDRRSFRVRLARAGPRSEPTAYEVVKFDGCFRRSDEAPRGVRSNTFNSNLQLIRRTRGRDDAIPLHTISGNDIVLTACVRIVRPPKIVNRLIDANALEYRTRHLIDGRIIDCDQRIGIVAGYMTDEVRNLSPFTFMHTDDVRWVIVALRQMYDCNSSYGESTYRLFTRNGNIIYLQSKGSLEIDKETNKVHSFVCVNTLLDEEEGKRRVQEMKKKFSVIINTKIPQSTIDVPASEHPEKLEKAVLCLIQNLQKSNSDGAGELEDDDDDDGDDYEDDDDDDNEDDNDNDNSSVTITELSAERPSRHQQLREHHQNPHQHQRVHTYSGSSSSSMSQARMAATHHRGSAKTPPLALVPPEASSVKSSISKSVDVVNVTAAKHLRGIQQQQSAAVKSPSSLSCSCQGSGDLDCDFCQSPLTPAATPAAATTTTTAEATKRASSEELAEPRPPKRRFMPSTEIEQVLSSSLVQIERTLNRQLSVAKELRSQGNRYELPHANQRIDEIMEEHQKQSELYVNIKSEYEVQLENKANTTKSESDPHVGGSGGGSSGSGNGGGGSGGGSGSGVSSG